MPGITDLADLIRSMRPVQVAGEFVYVSVDTPDPDLPAHAMVREPALARSSAPD